MVYGQLQVYVRVDYKARLNREMRNFSNSEQKNTYHRMADIVILEKIDYSMLFCFIHFWFCFVHQAIIIWIICIET